MIAQTGLPLTGGRKAGIISKPYGIRGELQLILEPDVLQYIEMDHPLFIDMDGQRVPFFMEELEEVSERQAIVRFEFIHTLEEAKKVSGKDLYLDPRVTSRSREDENHYTHLIGYKAFNQDALFLGTVKAYVEHELNPLLVIENEGREFLVPASEALITKIEPGKDTVWFDLPEGLTTL